jgi:hypothetical protein
LVRKPLVQTGVFFYRGCTHASHRWSASHWYTLGSSSIGAAHTRRIVDPQATGTDWGPGRRARSSRGPPETQIPALGGPEPTRTACTCTDGKYASRLTNRRTERENILQGGKLSWPSRDANSGIGGPGAHSYRVYLHGWRICFTFDQWERRYASRLTNGSADRENMLHV